MNKFDEFIMGLKQRGNDSKTLIEVIDYLSKNNDMYDVYILLYNIQDNVLKLSNWFSKNSSVIFVNSSVFEINNYINNYNNTDLNSVNAYLLEHKNILNRLVGEVIESKYREADKIEQINKCQNLQMISTILERSNTIELYKKLNVIVDYINQRKFMSLSQLKQFCLPTYQKYDKDTNNNQTANALVEFITNGNSRGFTGETKQRITEYGQQQVVIDMLKLLVKNEYLRRRQNIEDNRNSTISLIYDNVDQLDTLLPLILKSKECLQSLSKEAVKEMIFNNEGPDLIENIELENKLSYIEQIKLFSESKTI